MRLLAIETSAAACSVAAWDAGAPPGARLRGYRRLDLGGRGHAEALLPMVLDALDRAGWRFADLDALAVNRGPGGFTGIRIGVAAARGLALAAGLPVVGVTGLEALAAAAAPAPGAAVLAALDARRGQVYAQTFDAGLEPSGEPRALPPAEAALGLPRPLLLVGSGAASVRSCLPEDDPARIRDATLDAAAVAARAAARLAAGDVSPGAGFDLTPLYLRPPDARPQTPVVGPSGGAAFSLGA
ncbi:MAG TPA: tRNA (adenosine(37)-N6)-threonylcarbamoyltransferase complex dimerization subunit type 1 TsaB [Geminicoccaceae bacterium]|nr:tRNA (adenosine(37)-N6)-threonylcarbamoyltransferase complex dimerization subunit type 1 TsaB [Geminicoccaceae bacterium]